MSVAFSAMAVALFGFLCWYVAGASASTSVRICRALGIAVFIGMLAGSCGILYGWVCWLILIALSAARRARDSGRRGAVVDTIDGDTTRRVFSIAHVMLFVVAAYAVWPSIVRPPTDGDTLIYHLPNAAAWLHAHSLWTSSTTYWWYPAASELAVATLLATCGPYALPLVSFAALLALGFGVYELAVANGIGRWLALSASLALTTSHTIIIEAGDMQNDVFLGALFVASLARTAGAGRYVVLAALALTKPIGWAYGAVAAFGVGRGRAAAVGIVVIAVALWCLRDRLLFTWSGDAIPIVTGGGVFATSILAHGFDGMRTLAASSVRDAWSTALFVFAGLIACVVPSPLKLRAVALGAVAIWVASPFSYESGGIAQLAIGASLRFGIPAMALGCVLLVHLIAKAAEWHRVLATVAWLGFGALALSNLRAFAAIYANDGSATPGIPLLAAAIVLALFYVCTTTLDVRVRRTVVAIALLGILAFGFERRERAPATDYYRDAAGEHGRSPSIADLIMKAPGPVLLTDGTQSGMATVLRPDLDVENFPIDANPCDVARRMRGTAILLHDSPATAANATAGCERRVSAAGDVTIAPRER